MLSDQLRVSKEEQENISYLFRKVTRNLRGKSYKLIAAGCVWYYVKRRRLEREVEDMICNLTGFEKLELRRAYRFVREKVGVSFSDELKKNVYLILDKIYPDFTPKSKKIKATADQILKVVKENRMHQGRSPSIIATAIDYMAIKLNSGETSQTGLADLAHITEASLRNNYKRLMQMLYIEIAF